MLLLRFNAPAAFKSSSFCCMRLDGVLTSVVLPPQGTSFSSLAARTSRSMPPLGIASNSAWIAGTRWRNLHHKGTQPDDEATDRRVVVRFKHNPSHMMTIT